MALSPTTRRLAHLALAGSFAIVGIGSVAADGDPAGFVDCSPEDDVTYVLEGEPHEQTVLAAPLTFPIGDAGWSDPNDEPFGGATYALVRVNEFYAVNFVDGNKPSVSLTIDWDGVGDIDVDVFDSQGTLVGEGHNFNTYGDDTKEVASWIPVACETYDVAISNNFSQPAQNITVTTEVISRAPRRR